MEPDPLSDSDELLWIDRDDDSDRLKRCPVGGYNICPATSSTPAPTLDPDTVTENPLGTCRCNGELWVAEGCSYGFVCDDTAEKGGYLKNCPEVRKIIRTCRMYYTYS